MGAFFKAGAEWLAAHWVPVALIVSEIAALLPFKVSGILQGIIKVGTAIFGKKSNNNKNLKS